MNTNNIDNKLTAYFGTKTNLLGFEIEKGYGTFRLFCKLEMSKVPNLEGTKELLVSVLQGITSTEILTPETKVLSWIVDIQCLRGSEVSNIVLEDLLFNNKLS
jgi:hypothetical protein